MQALLGELMGTMVLIIFGAGVVAGHVLKKTKSENAGWLSITVGWGFAVTMGVYVAGTASDAHLNPAVSLALATIGEFAWADVPFYVIGQLLGAFIGAAIVFVHYYPHWEKTEDTGAKLAVFSTGPAIRHYPSNFISEFIGTAVLLFGLLAIGANQFAEGLNPLVVGVLIVAIGLSLGGTTGYAINPARDFGPRLAHAILPIKGKGTSDFRYALVPILGPIAGGIVGALVFVWLLK
ncbi:MIP/aquaporin family protein [Shouchella lonarensis]|uniref:Glycerol uptake facilitator protein n=1 Tax=Shouchella lonarensis TaxID=1464122 RepID=A0A1G6H576_9BACI|nr:MIP/aquaporin family protein [Shouchella lonarensis]SDB88616.1 glycerol uptake facilitator protein [Shouchella lonarensis]